MSENELIELGEVSEVTELTEIGQFLDGGMVDPLVRRVTPPPG